jgi:hypothetical protein
LRRKTWLLFKRELDMRIKPRSRRGGIGLHQRVHLGYEQEKEDTAYRWAPYISQRDGERRGQGGFGRLGRLITRLAAREEQLG